MGRIRATPGRLVRWYDASDLSTLFQDDGMTTPVATNADPVGAWMDKSGNGGHALQSTSSRRPTYRTAIQNGLPALLWDGIDDYLRDLTLLLPPPYTLVVVHRLTSTLTQWLVSGVGSSSRIDFNVGNGGTGAYQWVALGGPFDMTTGNIAQTGIGKTFIGVGDVGRSSFRMSTTRIPQANMGPTAWQGMSLGISNVDTLSARAYLCEVRLYAGRLTTGQIDALEADLSAKWGTS